MKITVVGTGYVGLVAGVCLASKGHEIICIDINKDKINMLQQGISPIYENGLEELLCSQIKNDNIIFTTNKDVAYKDANLIIIGVGTPENNDGSTNLTYLYSVANDIANTVSTDVLIVVKSTVPVGTCYELESYIKDNLVNHVSVEVASNPEFLSQGNAVNNMLYPSRIVIGTHSDRARDILNEVYRDFNAKVVEVSVKSAEMIKYACNDFLALKISYINEIANLCELVGADIDEVTKGMSFDRRIGNEFLEAGIGYGGSCLVKDTKALQHLAKVNNYDLYTVDATINVNEKQNMILYTKALNKYKTFKDKTVAILGYTFKPNTDDVRNAPAINNIIQLLKDGAHIKSYDLVGVECLKKSLCNYEDILIRDNYCINIYSNGSIQFVNSIEEALSNSQMCFIFTQWEDIKNMNIQLFHQLMQEAVVFDGRNIFDPDVMRDEHIEYYSIGRGF